MNEPVVTENDRATARRAIRLNVPASVFARIERHVDKESAPPHWLWTRHLDHSGYARMSWQVKGVSASSSVIRLMLEQRLGRRLESGKETCHVRSCPYRHCVNPDCLYEGSSKENSEDMVALGRSTVGDRNPARRYPERIRWGASNPSAKHSTEEVADAIARVEAGETRKAVAESIEVCKMTVSEWVRGTKRPDGLAYRAALKGVGL